MTPYLVVLIQGCGTPLEAKTFELLSDAANFVAEDGREWHLLVRGRHVYEQPSMRLWKLFDQKLTKAEKEITRRVQASP